MTFDVSEREQLLIRAGVDEMENRTLFSGDVTGRYAVVPVDELVEANQPQNEEMIGFDSDPLLEDMRIIGDSVRIPRDRAQHVALYKGGEQVVEFDSKGAYGLLWVPYE